MTIDEKIKQAVVDYAKLDTDVLIDNGKLFFAATALQSPYEQMQKLEKENAKLKLDIEGRKEAYSHLDDINIRLNFEIIRLKEQLKLAESQLFKAIGSAE